MKIYADVLFLTNFVMDTLIFYTARVLLRHSASFKRIAVVGIICALLGTVFGICFLKNALAQAVTELVLLIAAVKIIFRPASLFILFKSCITVLFTAFFAAGIFIWLRDWSNIIYFWNSDKLLTAGTFLICAVVVTVVFLIWHKGIRQEVFESETYIKAEIWLNNRNTYLNVFKDSGCMLGNRQETVIVAEAESLCALFDGGFSAELIKCTNAEEILSTAKKHGKQRYFDYMEVNLAAGKSKMALMRLDKAIFSTAGKSAERNNIFAAVYIGRLFNDNDCNALMGSRAVKNIFEEAA